MNVQDATKLSRIYHIFDAESIQDGSISTSKIIDVIRMFGQNPTPAEGRRLLADIDTDKDHHVSFRELCTYFAANGMRLIVEDKASKRRTLLQLMTIFDKNNDNQINKKELREMLLYMGQPLNKRELREAFSGLDMDQDGKLSFEELLAGLDN